MSDFEKLIDAAKRGDLADVRAILAANNPAEFDFINQRDPSGATAIHYAAFGGHCSVVEELVSYGANVNAIDSKFGATPAGWAIEYLREMGGFLGIELTDFAHAIRQGDVEWVKRFLRRFPALRSACDTQGKPFKLVAQESGNREMAELFGSSSLSGS